MATGGRVPGRSAQGDAVGEVSSRAAEPVVSVQNSQWSGRGGGRGGEARPSKGAAEKGEGPPLLRRRTGSLARRPGGGSTMQGSVT